MYRIGKERLYESCHDDDTWNEGSATTSSRSAPTTLAHSYGYPVTNFRQLNPVPADARASYSDNYTQPPSSRSYDNSEYYTNSAKFYNEDEQMTAMEQPQSVHSRLYEEQRRKQYQNHSELVRQGEKSDLHKLHSFPLPNKNRVVDRSNNITIKTVAQTATDNLKRPNSSTSSNRDLNNKNSGQGRKKKQGNVQGQSPQNKVVRVSTGETTPATSLRKPSVSATLFLELSAERRLKLQEMADKFSESLDKNECKNVLDEVEFLLKLFCTASKNEYITPEEEEESENDPLFYNATEQTDFVIKVIISQLDNLFVNLPKSIIQLIIDNYPHRILQKSKKDIDAWMIAQETSKLLSTPIETQTHNTLLEKNLQQKYGRSSFSTDSDYSDFQKQQSKYYAIREAWVNMITLETDPDAPPSEVVTVPKNLFSFHAKISSFFQINNTPTNIFLFASLFIDHYLMLEQMQEKLSDNVQKGLSPGSKQILAFQRHFLFSSPSIFLQHVVDKLLMDITKAEEIMGSPNAVAEPSKLCRTMKDTIYLARLLGLALFLPYLGTEEHKAGSIGMDPVESLKIRNYQGPPLDLVDYMEKALKFGRLTTTCPWIVDYLLYCDSVAFFLPSYQPVLSMIIFIYKKILVPGSTSYAISITNKNFLRFYFGMLFSSDKFPSSALSLESQNVPFDTSVVGGGGIPEETEKRIDNSDNIGRSMIEYFFHSSFNRFRRILGWRTLEIPIGDRVFTGSEFQHMLSVVETDNSSTPTSTSSRLQAQLEAAFFDAQSPSVKRNIEFIAESVWSNFLIFLNANLLPYLKNLTAHQGLFGEAAAKKCRERLGEEMNKHMPQRCITAIKVCLEQLVPPDVMQLCWRVALQKAKKNGWNWINIYIKADMFKKDKTTSSNSSSQINSEALKIVEDPPTEILRLIHHLCRQLHMGEQIDYKFFDKILACQSLVNVPWDFNPLADLTFALIAFVPRNFRQGRMTKLVSIWKRVSPNEANVINPRNLMLLTKTGFTNASWLKLGKLTQLLLTEGILTPTELEKQCLELTKHNWCDTKSKKLLVSDYLTLVMDTYNNKDKPGPSSSSQSQVEFHFWRTSSLKQ